ncbi:MAG: TetR/AcrR family transcriptional regulator C-terminal domain-containing protein [Kutzneria sp.]|nr:TetR/AcrR family transcriptional regulator C-terminal domain-containing protein [Kutzneria sp.]MBV9846391.1 TetR/AcrR family transcriptional regulator C-terminal domain-containing protein [Kutzneria sp.]
MSAKNEHPPTVWARETQQRARPTLSRAHIVAEAIRLLDTDGIEGLSMRRLGAQLGAGATSLYRHVANKDELIELAVDAVYGELSLSDRADLADWRGGVTRTANRMRELILRHPWIAAVSAETGLSYLGPNVMRACEDVLAIFVAAGCTIEDADLAVNTVFAYVIGATTGEAALTMKLASRGLDVSEWADGLRAAAERAARPYPHAYQAYLSYAGRESRDIAETQFTQGLQLILDGVAPLTDHPSPPSGR